MTPGPLRYVLHAKMENAPARIDGEAIQRARSALNKNVLN